MTKRQPLLRPVPVKEVIWGLMKPLDWENLGQHSRIREVWERVVPRQLLPHTRLLELRRRKLVVEVSAAAWGQELHFSRPAILAALQKSLGPEIIQDIKVRLASGK